MEAEELHTFLAHFQSSGIQLELASAVHAVISCYSRLARPDRPAHVRPSDSLREEHGIDARLGHDLDTLVALILERCERRLKQPVIAPISLFTVEGLVQTLSDLTVSTEGDMLLRPANQPPSSGSLLRPAKGETEPDKENLLRPSS